MQLAWTQRDEVYTATVYIYVKKHLSLLINGYLNEELHASVMLMLGRIRMVVWSPVKFDSAN